MRTRAPFSKNTEILKKSIEDLLKSETPKDPIYILNKSKVNNPQHNILTKYHFTGANAIQLAALKYSDNRWMTENQAFQLGYKIKSGEKPTNIENWKNLPTGEPFLSTYSVYNGSQVVLENGMPIPPEKPLLSIEEKIEEIEKLTKGIDINNEYDGVPHYDPMLDVINIPDKTKFINIDIYYSVLLHEMVHWTSHENRCARNLNKYGTDIDVKSQEEMIAEIGSLLLCEKYGLSESTKNLHIKHMKSINYESMFSVSVKHACAEAEKAVNYLLSKEQIIEKNENNDVILDPNTDNKQNGNKIFSSQKTIIYVPYKERLIVKNLGAKYDPAIKRWYVPPKNDITPFKKYLPFYKYIVHKRQNDNLAKSLIPFKLRNSEIKKVDDINKVIDDHQKWLKGDTTGKQADLSGCDLSNIYFKDNLDLRKAIFKDSIFNLCTLNNAKLDGADISGSVFIGSDLSGTSFKNCKCSDIKIIYSNFDKTNMSNIDITNSIINKSSFQNCNFEKSNFKNFTLEKIIFNSSHFFNNSFNKCLIQGNAFNNSDLSFSKFNDCDIYNNHFPFANLSFSSFKDTKINSFFMKETKVNGIIYKKSSRFRNYSDSTLNDILNASKNDILANNSSDINEMDKYKTRSPKTNLIGFGNNSHINTEIRKSQDLTEKIILKQKREIPFLKNVNINNRNSKGTKFER